MITTTGQREIEKFNVYRDDVNGMQFYVMPKAPVIALDDTGKPIFSLVMYRRDITNMSPADRATKLGGGILSFSVELQFTDDDEKKIRAELAKDPTVQFAYQMQQASNPVTAPYYKWPPPGGQPDLAAIAKALVIAIVPVTDGSVGVAILAEDGTKPGQFVNNVVGSGPVAMSGLQRASFMASLTQDGATLVWQMIEKNLAAIRVQYQLKFNYRVLGLELIAVCNASKAYSTVHSQYQSAQENAQFMDVSNGSSSWHTYNHDQSASALDVLGSIMSSNEFSNVTLNQECPDTEVKPEDKTALIQQGNDMIKDFLASTFLNYNPGASDSSGSGDNSTDPNNPNGDVTTNLPQYDGKKYGGDSASKYSLKAESDVVMTNFYYDMKMQSVEPGTFNPNDNLSNILQGRDVKQFRTEVDLSAEPFWRYLDVQIVCTADFANDPISLVKAHLTYAGTAATGPTIKDFLFQAGQTTPQNFAAFLSAPKANAYTYEYEVYYKGSQDKYTISGSTKETILVLNTDGLGVLKVAVQAGIIDWDNDISKVMVKMNYGDNIAEEFIFDAGHQSHLWTAVVGQPVTNAYTYTLSFVMKGDDQRIDLDPISETSRTLVINEPLDMRHTVLFVAAGSFGDVVKQIAVAVKYQDTSNNYEVDDVFMMAKDGDSHSWKFRLRDKTLTTISYKVTVFYVDNTQREDDWVSTSDPIIVCGDAFDAKVSIVPYLMRAGGVWAFGTIDLWYSDPKAQPAPISVHKTLEIDDFGKPLTWRFRLGALDRRQYTYQLTVYRTADNKMFQTPVLSDDKEVLVLTPPQTS